MSFTTVSFRIGIALIAIAFLLLFSSLLIAAMATSEVSHRVSPGGRLISSLPIILFLTGLPFLLPDILRWQARRRMLRLLIEVLRNPTHWPASLEPGVRLGGPHIPRYDAATLIAEEFGPGGAGAVPALIEALGDPDEYTRRAVIRALDRIGQPANSAIPILIETLADESFFVRAEAASLLRELGVDSESPSLIRILNRLDPYDRSQVIVALGNVSCKIDRHVSPLVLALAGADKMQQSHAIDELGPAAFPQLIDALDYRETRIREHAIRHLTRFGSSTIPHFLRLTRDPEYLVRTAAIAGLGCVGQNSPEAIAAIIDALRDEDLQFVAVKAIGEIGPAGVAAVDMVKELTTDEHPDWLRAESAIALWKITGSPDVSLPVLCSILGSRDPFATSSAFRGLRGMGAAAQAAIPSLIDQLFVWDGDRSMVAAELIGQFGASAKEAIPMLTAALESHDSRTRLHAAMAIWRIDRRNPREVVATLTELLDANGIYHEFFGNQIMVGPKSSTIRAQAAEALREIGPAAETAIPTLQEALRDEDMSLREAARRAISSIEQSSG